MVAGDTTYVRAGTYHEGIIRFSKSGTKAAPIKLVNYSGESPVIDCIDKNAFHRILIQNSAGPKFAIGWITVEGFEIRNCYEGIKVNGVNDLTIRRNWIHDNKFQGILGNGTRILIDRNIINHNGQFDECLTNPPACNLDHGIYLAGTAVTVTNNLIYDNLTSGIQTTGSLRYDSAKYPGPEYVDAHDWVIANNTIAYQAYGPAIVLWGSTILNTQIKNNIFYENRVNGRSAQSNGIAFTSMTGTGITIKSNLSYASGSGGAIFLGPGATEGVHYTQSDNIVNVSTPAFVNAPATLPASPNFALTERSPAIDAGGSLAMTSIAVNGIQRPQGATYDIGAYEYDPAGDGRPPRAPTTLRAN